MQFSIVVHEVEKLPGFKQPWGKAGRLLGGIDSLGFLGSSGTRTFSLENYALACQQHEQCLKRSIAPVRLQFIYY
jgi:hypothetical protein